MQNLMLRPVAAAAVLTAGSVILSVALTTLILLALDVRDFTIGLLLAALLPAAMAPGPTYMLVRSIARLRQMHDELERQANTDLLTGLPNRRAFFTRAPGLLASPVSAADGAAVMMIDLDHFKRVNDTHGHATGDAMLEFVARTLIRALHGPEDFVARLGGEEFAAILPGATPAEADATAERICQGFRQLRVDAGAEIDGELTASIGISMVATGANIDTALRVADQAVYLAKRAGRDRWVRDGAIHVPQQPVETPAGAPAAHGSKAA
ncbi:MAG: GGDEF domain-containing protein [Bauldia sp.]|nr:GGDEF domain-containing protein [Bauldia sp.]